MTLDDPKKPAPLEWWANQRAPKRSPLEEAHELRKRAAELRAEATRLDRQAAILTLDAHKAGRK